MLVLSRKVGQEIIIGDNIRVQVLWVRGNQVRLGFTAPVDVPISREEICPSARRSETPIFRRLRNRATPQAADG
jgi:carbon storage regulator